MPLWGDSVLFNWEKQEMRKKFSWNPLRQLSFGRTRRQQDSNTRIDQCVLESGIKNTRIVHPWRMRPV